MRPPFARLCVVVAVAGACLLARPASAQTSRSDPSDLQAWLGASVGLDFPKRWEGGVEYRMRLVGDAGTYRGSYLTLELAKRVADPLELFASYRLSLLDDGTFHRWAGGAEARTEVGPLTLSLRPMLQAQRRASADDDENASRDKVLARARLRGRLPVTSRLELYASTEPYFRFGADYPVDNWRNTLGLEWAMGERRTIDLFYIYRPDYAKSYNRTFHVIGVEVGFDLDLDHS